ncbi:MAG: methylase [Parcubacteria group bacterium Gr01-1014_107]|nr:MAG: methylase [Parcubacteria group bacterium Gr01-1014_107]
MGSGSGFYTMAAAKLVGEHGRVYAVDIQKELLITIKREAERQHLLNVEIIWGDVEKSGGTKLANSSVDTVIASNILFQLEDKESFTREVGRILKKGKGKVFIVDWLDAFGGLGPEPTAVVSPGGCKKLFLEEGFEFYKEFPTGPHHYGLAFRKI